MYKIRFKPFVGKNYHSENFKILVLGESHYLNEEEFKKYLNKEEIIEQITNKVFKHFLNYKEKKGSFERWMNTFSKFGNILSDKKLSNSETIDFWNRMAFYNYVQYPTKGARISPSLENFERSIKPFEDVIDSLKPDLIFIWGKRLWNNLPKENYEQINKNELTNESLEYFYKTPIIRMYHPSSSKFNYSLSNHANESIKNFKRLKNK